jgi:hypothetical protein
MRNPDLWHRISRCHPDDVEAAFPFSHRLARDNGWTKSFAARVVVEYQRFAYLSQMKAGMVTPSDEVDQTWHLHLTYTRHYWGPFKEALGAALHHMPTKGGVDQAQTFRRAYEETLALYRQEFGEPPSDIWPPAHLRFGRAPHFLRINTQDFWVLRKPGWLSMIKTTGDCLRRVPASLQGVAMVLFALFAGTGLALAHGTPAGDTVLEQLRNMVWHWATEHTLWFFFGIVAVALVLIALLKKSTKGSGCGSGGCGSDGGGGGGSGCGGCGD